MDFIKRHYEKLLLLLMLVLFIGIMIYVVQVAEQARSVKDSELTFRESDLKRNIVKVKTPEELSKDYNAGKIIADGKSNWKESTQRESFDKNTPSVAGTYSDLVEAVRIASCPHCKKLIPRFYFKNNVKCPACAVPLADVPSRPKERRRFITESDFDGDGMPNSYETAKGLNPNDPTDQVADKDRDGYSNLFEFENGTDPTNPKDRAPLWYRLRYITMESVILPLKLRAISTQNYKEKDRWILQFSFPVISRKTGKVIMDGNVPRETSESHSIGDTIKIEDKIYKIADANFEQRQLGKDRVVDLSTVKLVQVLAQDATIKPDVLIVQVNKDLRSNDKRLVLEDVGTPITNDSGRGDNGRRKYIIKVGQTIRLGNRNTDVESYRLQRVDERSKLAYFERPDAAEGDLTQDAQGKKIVVTRDSEIPEDVQVKNVKPMAPASRESR